MLTGNRLILVLALAAVLVSRRVEAQGSARPQSGDDERPADERLSPRYSLSDWMRSQTAQRMGIEQRPSPAQVGAMEWASGFLERLSDAAGVRLRITGGWRSPALNDAVGGSKRCPGGAAATSQLAYDRGCGSDHMSNPAGSRIGVDVMASGYSSRELAELVARVAAAEGMPIAQIVHYQPGRSNHTHLSFRRSVGGREVLFAPVGGGYEVDSDLTELLRGD